LPVQPGIVLEIQIAAQALAMPMPQSTLQSDAAVDFACRSTWLQ